MAHLAHYREAHPMPFVVTHWINLVCMFLLIFTGFYIHYPFFPFAMSMARGIHVLCGIVVTLNCIARIVMSLFIKSSPTGGTREQVLDIKTWLPQGESRHQFIAWIKYYLFFQKEHPLGAKLGVPQKIAYLVIPVCILLMAWTGFALWIPTSEWGISQFLINNLGVMNVRLFHYFVMFVIIIIMMFHIYLANIEGVAPTKLILFRKEHGGLVYDPAKHNVIGYDGLGHDPDFGEVPGKTSAKN